MYIHIGQKKIVSDKNHIGFFNAETLRLSDENNWILAQIKTEDKTIAIDVNNAIIASKVSPYTIIKRTSLEKDIIWRREHDK